MTSLMVAVASSCDGLVRGRGFGQPRAALFRRGCAAPVSRIRAAGRPAGALPPMSAEQVDTPPLVARTPVRALFLPENLAETAGNCVSDGFR